MRDGSGVVAVSPSVVATETADLRDERPEVSVVDPPVYDLLTGILGVEALNPSLPPVRDVRTSAVRLLARLLVIQEIVIDSPVRSVDLVVDTHC